jgi:serine/threonine protein kinase
MYAVINRADVRCLYFQMNVLLDDEWHARLADFGLTAFAEATMPSQSTSRRGSIRWMAPELHRPQSVGLDVFKRTPATDVYAFACICVEVGTFTLHPCQV